MRIVVGQGVTFAVAYRHRRRDRLVSGEVGSSQLLFAQKARDPLVFAVVGGVRSWQRLLLRSGQHGVLCVWIPRLALRSDLIRPGVARSRDPQIVVSLGTRAWHT